MALDTTTPRARRTILAATLGGLAATIAAALSRPERVLAGSDGDVVLGAANTTTAETQITNTATDGNAFLAYGSGSGTGVYGQSPSGIGVEGISFSSRGVHGYSSSAAGVNGYSGSLNGVQGQSANSAASGVYGFNTNHGYGVAGRSNAGPLVSGAGAAATLGDNTADGIGVWARSAHGIGLYAQAVNTDAVALKAQGVVKFSRSGRASVPINAKYVDVTVSGGLNSAANVLALLQASRSGVWVRAVRTNYPSSGKARIYLNKVASTSATTPVAWFVLG